MSDEGAQTVPRIGTWEGAIAWLESRQLRVVASPELRGRFAGTEGFTPGEDVGATLSDLCGTTNTRFRFVARDLIAIRLPMPYEQFAPQDCTQLQQAILAFLRLVGALPEHLRQSLPRRPLATAELGGEARYWLDQFTRLSHWRPGREAGEVVLFVVYAPRLRLDDGTRQIACPLRRTFDAWFPQLVVTGAQWSYSPPIGDARLAAPSSRVLAGPLVDDRSVDIGGGEAALGDLVSVLVPGAAVPEEVALTRVTVSRGTYARGELLEAVLEVAGVRLRELAGPDARPVYAVTANADPAQAPPEELEWHLRAEIGALAAALAPAYEAKLAAELSFPLAQLREGAVLSELGGQARACVEDRVAKYVAARAMDGLDERLGLGNDTFVQVEDGLLVGVAQYSLQGRWIDGVHLLLGVGLAQ